MRYKRKKDQNMATIIANNLSLSNFINQNKNRLYEEGRKNIKLNKDGKPTISKNDPWFEENEWDEYFHKMHNK
jgi:hypothetical protein